MTRERHQDGLRQLVTIYREAEMNSVGDTSKKKVILMWYRYNMNADQEIIEDNDYFIMFERVFTYWGVLLHNLLVRSHNAIKTDGLIKYNQTWTNWTVLNNDNFKLTSTGHNIWQLHPEVNAGLIT